jgi:hypothetical protein
MSAFWRHDGNHAEEAGHLGDHIQARRSRPDEHNLESLAGRTLTYKDSGIRSNGQHFYNEMTAKRTSGTSGLAGTWQTTGVTLGSPDEISIETWRSGGHFVTFLDRGQTVRMDFDGKEYRDEGPNVADGTTSAGRRLDERSIETTERFKGKIVETAKSQFRRTAGRKRL